MIIAVPLSDQNGMVSAVCEHFGSAPFYGIYDVTSKQLDIVSNANMEHEHGQCRPTDIFTDHVIEAVVCNGIGGRAVRKLDALGIAIYMAGQAPSIEVAIERFEKGELKKVDHKMACEGHDCH